MSAKAFGVTRVLEADKDIVRVADDYHSGHPLSPA
jgi:hypothetical protein